MVCARKRGNNFMIKAFSVLCKVRKLDFKIIMGVKKIKGFLFEIKNVINKMI